MVKLGASAAPKKSSKPKTETKKEAAQEKADEVEKDN